MREHAESCQVTQNCNCGADDHNAGFIAGSAKGFDAGFVAGMKRAAAIAFNFSPSADLREAYILAGPRAGLMMVGRVAANIRDEVERIEEAP